ncbi:MAG: TraY domain-containing protein [Propionibacteriaceae bacterium]|jgi:plasmid stability protein|nr:TraY domain-containing protein [Propionibacteriaceae bacterium]
MPTITVRNLDAEVHRRLKAMAERDGRSMEAEARVILAEATAQADWVAAWIGAAAPLRTADFTLPERHQPREIGLA